MNDWIKNLKPGSPVIIGEELRTVKKITPTGRIKVGCEYYDKNGNGIGKVPYILREATPEAVAQIESEKKRRRLLNEVWKMMDMMPRDIALEQVERIHTAIKQILEERENG